MSTGKPRKTILRKDLTRDNACSKCGSVLVNGFYKHHSYLCSGTGELWLCKTCCDELYSKFYNKTNDIKYSIFKMCKLLNYAFYLFVAKASEKMWKTKNNSTTPFSCYLGMLKTLCVQKKIPYNDFECAEQEYSMELLSNENSFIVTPEIRFKWGNNLESSDYEFLQVRYLEYCRNVDTDIRTMESLVEEICHIELSIRKAREERNTDIKTMKDMNDILQKLLTSAGLDSKSKREIDNSDMIDTYGIKIKEIEEHEPCEIFEDRNLFTDFDGILSYFKKYLFRPLKNLVLGTRDFNISSDDLSEEYYENTNG